MERAPSLTGLDRPAEATAEPSSPLLDAIPYAVITTDIQGLVTGWNGQAETLYGWSSAEALGRPIYDLTVPEPSREQAEQIMAALERGDHWAGEFRVSRRDGSSFLARVIDSPVRDEGGAVVGVIGLSEAVGVDVEDAGDPGSDAAGVDEETRQLLAVVAHELRAPLTGALGFAQRLMHEAAASAGDLGDRRDVLRLIVGDLERAHRSLELVSRTVELDGDDGLDYTRIDVARLISSEIGQLRSRYPDATVTLHPAAGLPLVEADEDAVMLVVRNLVENALTYGGDPPAVSITLGRSAGDVLIRVTDNGHGVSERDRDAVFQPFVRGSEAVRSSRGMGLGLYLSRRLAERCGGSLTVDGAAGEGATFTLRLPVTTPPV